MSIGNGRRNFHIQRALMARSRLKGCQSSSWEYVRPANRNWNPWPLSKAKRASGQLRQVDPGGKVSAQTAGRKGIDHRQPGSVGWGGPQIAYSALIPYQALQGLSRRSLGRLFFGPPLTPGQKPIIQSNFDLKVFRMGWARFAHHLIVGN